MNTKDESGFIVEAKLQPFNGDPVQLSLSPRFSRSRPTVVCVRRDTASGACQAEDERGDWDDLENMDVAATPRLIAAADAADSMKMYVVVNMMHHHAGMPTTWSPCSDNPDQECANGGTAVESSGSTAIYHVSFTTGSWTLVTLPASAQAARTIGWLGIAETGKEMVYGMGYTAQRYGGPCTNQSTEFVSLAAATAGQVLRHVSLPDGGVCSGEYEAGGSVAPSRIPLAVSRLTAGAASPAPRTRGSTGRGPVKR